MTYINNMSIEIFQKIIETCTQEQLHLVDSLNDIEIDSIEILKIKTRIEHINLIIQSITNYIFLD
jgi:hypothetical protein